MSEAHLGRVGERSTQRTPGGGHGSHGPGGALHGELDRPGRRYGACGGI